MIRSVQLVRRSKMRVLTLLVVIRVQMLLLLLLLLSEEMRRAILILRSQARPYVIDPNGVQ